MKITPRQIKCRTMLEAQGYSRSGASALVGNFAVESGSDLPTAFRTKNLDHGSNGLAQWRLDRLLNYQDFVRTLKPELIEEGMSDAEIDQALWPWYGRMDFQTRFVAMELKASFPDLHAKLVTGGDVAALAADVCWQYERPNKAMSHIADRIAYAQGVATDTTGVAPTDAKPTTVTVTEHLDAAAAAHAKQAAGGTVAALVAAVAGGALFVSNFVHAIPTWQWIALLVLTLVVFAGLLAAGVQQRAAANIKAAIPGVSKVPAPVPTPAPVRPAPAPTRQEVEDGPIPTRNEIGAAMADASRRDAALASRVDDLDRALIAQLVEAEIARRGLVPQPTMVVAQAQPISTAGAALPGEATMSIHRAQEGQP